MSFQWLQMRISEESDRRQREAQILDRLPRVVDEIYRALQSCVETYATAFGPESIEIAFQAQKVRVTLREQRDGKWEKISKVEITPVPALPGLHIDRNGEALEIEVGLLAGEKMFYKDGEEYLTMEELTRRVLDRAMFPKLTNE